MECSGMGVRESSGVEQKKDVRGVQIIKWGNVETCKATYERRKRRIEKTREEQNKGANRGK